MQNKDRHSDSEELKKLAPHLHEMSKDNSFKVPEGYFEMLPTAVAERIAEQPAAPGITSIFKRYRTGWATGLVASIALVVYLFNPSEPDTTLSEVNSASFESYLENELIAEYSAEELEEEYLALYEEKQETASQEDFDQELEHYLLEEDIDLELLIDEL